MYRVLIICLSLILFEACSPDEEIYPVVSSSLDMELECNEDNLIAIWNVLDSIKTIYHDLDSISLRLEYKEIGINTDGSGYVDKFYSDPYFFTWSLQCDSTILKTVSGNFISNYTIINNKLNYKQMQVESYNSGLNWSFYTKREFFRKR